MVLVLPAIPETNKDGSKEDSDPLPISLYEESTSKSIHSLFKLSVAWNVVVCDTRDGAGRAQLDRMSCD